MICFMRVPPDFNPSRQARLARPYGNVERSGPEILHCATMSQIGIAADETWKSTTTGEYALHSEAMEPLREIRDKALNDLLAGAAAMGREEAFNHSSDADELTGRLAEVDSTVSELTRIYADLTRRRKEGIAKAISRANDMAALRLAYKNMIDKGGCNGPEPWPNIPFLGKIGCSKLICPFANDPSVQNAKQILDQRGMSTSYMFGRVNCREL